MKNIVNTENFRRNLQAWLSNNDQASAEFLNRNRQYIPQILRNYTAPIYRGMSVTQDVLDILDKGIFVFKKHTSWSKDKKIAAKFVNDPAFSLYSNVSDKRIKIILEIKPSISQQIMDIDSFVSIFGKKQLTLLGYDETAIDSAMKEKEVLMQKALKISKTSYTKI
jgi:hypothetical protein